MLYRLNSFFSLERQKGRALDAANLLSEVKIDSSWQNLTDTCNLVLPRNISVNGDRFLSDTVSQGDKITIEYGYNGALRQEFTGYVTKINTRTPVELELQDQMWLIKRRPLVKSWRHVSLTEVLNYIKTEVGADFKIVSVESDLGKFTINKATGAQVLQEIRKTYGIASFFRQGVLVVGDPYKAFEDKLPNRHTYNFYENIISHDLSYIREQDIRIKVTAISMLPNGKKIEIELGDPEGEQRTLTFANLSESELKKAATRKLDELRFDGYRGSFLSFGVPAAEHGDIAIIEDPQYPERAGSYFIDKVSKSFGGNGSRREITLGPKATF